MRTLCPCTHGGPLTWTTRRLPPSAEQGRGSGGGAIVGGAGPRQSRGDRLRDFDDPDIADLASRAPRRGHGHLHRPRCGRMRAEVDRQGDGRFRPSARQRAHPAVGLPLPLVRRADSSVCLVPPVVRVGHVGRRAHRDVRVRAGWRSGEGLPSPWPTSACPRRCEFWPSVRIEKWIGVMLFLVTTLCILAFHRSASHGAAWLVAVVDGGSRSLAHAVPARAVRRPRALGRRCACPTHAGGDDALEGRHAGCRGVPAARRPDRAAPVARIRGQGALPEVVLQHLQRQVLDRLGRLGPQLHRILLPLADRLADQRRRPRRSSCPPRTARPSCSWGWWRWRST